MRVLEIAVVMVLLIVSGAMALAAFSAAALMIAGDIMGRQNEWKDKGREEAKREKF